MSAELTSAAATKTGEEPSENQYSSERGRRPRQARVSPVRVLASRKISPSFVRVTFGPAGAGDPVPVGGHGADQWFRLFLPPDPESGAAPVLPLGGIEGWFQRLNALPPGERPVVRNYTVRERRVDGGHWELDVDFLLHRDSAGSLEGHAARWAALVGPGAVVGLLDQGVIARVEDGRRLLIVSDATGLPGVEGVLRGLDAGVAATVVVELPDPGDRRDLPSPARLDLRWVAAGGWRDAVGAADLEVDYVYAVGGTAIAQGVRRLALDSGLAPERVDFCTYWRHRRDRR